MVEVTDIFAEAITADHAGRDRGAQEAMQLQLSSGDV